uniref:Tachykinin-related peptide 1 n=7 Tax=Pentatomomorpha TaxID=33357 RepID=TRP1_NEZVI|nr:RecName: Full=Tachykinin-related peptide 1; Short=TKRP-1 [Acrosternum hilare]P86563.1 RecName: Full=Tachykinin-related peptide 1; Short=TKRP-1 [Banasa dimiata]P86569.1 RecName: Full=Tachykinin-related peptide 1; Short=TKRP-1 [Euschistus servus]P86575.1 RecName: Full=Tachykinin-related peptide 1; Short=TKRP-1 [Nezara viridula]P86582.1 RecName: Full=Tachykinin-related peptide 1; Short=TKRP-1 [Oncopeltus fasciatus]P86587.1 RecName: Full=Tachykinin-related peptide 1; Short=TKRP-1 [Pentatoma ruf
GPSGFLGMR